MRLKNWPQILLRLFPVLAAADTFSSSPSRGDGFIRARELN